MKLDTDRVGFISGKTSQTEFIYIDYIPDDDYLEPEDFFDINTDNRLSKWVYFFQQREFRNFEAIYDAPSEYTFNSFWKFPDDIEEIKITKAIYSDELPENDFVLIFSW